MSLGSSALSLDGRFPPFCDIAEGVQKTPSFCIAAMSQFGAKRPSSRLSISGIQRVSGWSRYLLSEIASAAK